ncbi:MAG: hypothetical protein A2X80_03765 [Geobacteraceae bacterium GWB2_52_12]|nr:MAG: hypothetical protein A2X80_03765 [Geobacteraceae bacterium GWB2_52_12]
MAPDIKSIETFRNDLIGLQAEIARKETAISDLTAEKNRLLHDRKGLDGELATARTTLDALREQTQALKGQLDNMAQESLQLKNELSAKNTALSAREKEVSELQKKNATLLKKGVTTETVLTELADMRIQNEFHKNQLLVRNQYMQQIILELENARSTQARFQSEKEGIEKVLKIEQEKRTLLEQELAAVKGRTEFSSSDISDYLNNAIDTFNSQPNLFDSSVNYIISELQVDLKAGIGTIGTDLTMVAPSQAQLTEQGLSSFKFTIRAVPATTGPA